jgi:hypothetical protein
MVEMSDYICGIKYFGDSIIVSETPIGSDLMKFDYICTVSLKTDDNDNRTYDVSIVNKDNVSGMPVGKWRIKKAKIYKDWGRSISYLIMEDEQGIETSIIKACEKDGGTKSRETVSFSFLTRAIFDKAQEIVQNYTNAKICNAIMELNKTKKSFNLSYHIKRYKEVSIKSDKEYIDFMELTANDITKYIKVYKTTADLLQKSDDPRSKQLLKDITSDCTKLLKCFRIEE